MKKYILLLLLIFAFPLQALAACGCTPGSGCTFERPDKTPYSQTENGVTVYCDNPEEADSIFATRSPMCGSSPEIAPHCAIMIDADTGQRNPSQLTCYGAEFSYAEKADPNGISKKIPEKKLSPVNGSVTFAGKTYTGVGQVLWCNSIAFCCARSDIGCEAPATTYSGFVEPVSPPNTWAQPNTKDLPMCAPPSGAGESRIFIPHLRNISVLATLLQTMFNPFPSSLDNNVAPVPAGKTATASVNAPDTLTSKIYFHQGLNDNSQYVSTENNSSLKVNAPAPDPLYSFTGGQVYKENGLCSITETKYNPGDDLLGPKITSQLLYTQKYTYPALPKYPGCTEDNNLTSDPGNCCSFKAAGIAASRVGADPSNVTYKCGTAPEYRENTKGQIAVFTKTPLIEYIYNTLVDGSQSVFKRLMPQGNPAEIKEIPSQAVYPVTADGNKLAVGGKEGGTPTLYFPHVGSLKEYFLDGIQKALRPLSAISTAVSASDNGSNSNATLQNIADKYGVPAGFLDAIWYIESGRGASGSNCNCNGNNACGPMQIGDGAYNTVSKPGETLNRCLLPDAFELAARLLLQKKYCTLQSCTYDKNNPTSNGGLNADNDVFAVGRYNGSNGCEANDETQCRWGTGYSYCDATRAIMNGTSLPTTGDQASCQRLGR